MWHRAVTTASCLVTNWRFKAPLRASPQNLLRKQTTAGRRILSTTSLTLFEVLLSMIVQPAAKVLHQSSAGTASRAAAKASAARNAGCVCVACLGVRVLFFCLHFSVAPVSSSCLPARLSGRDARSVRCGRPCRSELATCASVGPSLAANSGSVPLGLAASASSAAVSRDCFPLPCHPAHQLPGDCLQCFFKNKKKYARYSEQSMACVAALGSGRERCYPSFLRRDRLSFRCHVTLRPSGPLFL